MEDAIRQSLEEALLHDRNYFFRMIYAATIVDPEESIPVCLECFTTEYEHTVECPLQAIVELLDRE